MRELLDIIIIEPFQSFFQKFVEFLPNLLSFLVILLLGILFAWIIKLIVIAVLKIFHLDRFFSRTGIAGELDKIGIKETPTKIVGRMFYWLFLLIFIIIALNTLQIPAIEQFLGSFLLYLPNIFIAILLIIIGYILGNFLGRATLIASANAGVKFAGIISRVVKSAVVLLAFIMALEQLGIGRDTVIIAFTILFGGFVLALSLAFGLGGKDIASKYLEKKFKKEEDKKDELKHI